jgi:hypothetical protein
VQCHLEERTGREGGFRPAGDSMGGAATTDIGPTMPCAGGATWARRVVSRTGEGEGGLNGGPRPQC